MLASSWRHNRPTFLTLGLAAVLALCPAAFAGDQTWDNGSGNFTWDATSLNWSGTTWSNAAGDGAIFGPTGVGAIAVPAGISVNSFDISADGYSFTGPGPFTFVNGTSTQTTGVVNVAAGATAQFAVPINSAVGFQKIGPGTLVLSGAGNYTGAIPVTGNGLLRADVLIGGSFGTLAGGTLRPLSQAALPATTNVSIGNGYLDIGANNITLNNLTFTNQNPSAPWNTTLNANNGVIGSGTLRVTGEINVIGVTGNNAGNSIATNVDLGGGTQIVRVGLISSIGLNQSLMFNGSLSNGSLLKTIGYTFGGTFGSIDGISLHGNNTYTGSTIINSGTNVVTGTNASTLVKIAGIPAGPAGGSLSLQGANGSFLGATTIQAFAGGSFVLDNNASLGASGNNQPNIPAAQNNNRIRDDAAVQLRDGTFIYRGQSTVAASETFGSLSVQGGFNTFNITPNGTGGTATVTIAGDLTMVPRSTLLVSGSTLGAAGQVFVNGALPTPDATGILPRVVGSADFLTYNGTTGLTPYTGYATDFSTPGTNVAVTAASTVSSSVSINALKSTGTQTTTIGAGNTLTVASGMLLNTSGTHTITGGTLAFGSTPGIFFSGTNTVSSAITGTAGLIVPNGTTNLSGDLSGLTGPLTVQNGTATLSGSANTFTGPIEVRAGTLNFNMSQTGAGLGAITLGVAANDANLVGLTPTFNFSSAGANAVIDRPIVVDNGAMTAAGVPLSASLVTRFSPLSNTTGSQTLNGDITLNSSVNLQGGGGGGTGATNFAGNITGQGTFIIPNGRANFSGNVANTGGFLISNTGFTAQVSFQGTTSGTVPLTINGGNNSFVSYNAGSLPTGTITVQNASGSSTPSLTPLANSTINNAIVLNAPVNGNVGTGITAGWAGPIAGTGALNKVGDGTLVLSNPGNAYTGNTNVNAGTLALTGSGDFAGSPVVTVGATLGPILDVTGLTGGDNFDGSLVPGGSFALAVGQRLLGSGTVVGPMAVRAGSTVAPGNSIGTLTVSGNAAIDGVLEIETSSAATADLLNLTGTSGLVLTPNSILALPVGNTYDGVTPLTIVQLASGSITGTFGSVQNLPSPYAVQYLGSSIVLNPVPEPGTLALTGLAASAGIAIVRRRRRAKA